MAQTLFDNFKIKEQSKQQETVDTYWFKEKNPLDQSCLRQIEQEIENLIGCDYEQKVKISVLGAEDFRSAVSNIIPKRLLDRGLGHHIRVLHDPRDPHHIMISPSAIAGLNDGQMNVVTDLVYHLLSSTGFSINETFDRGISDILAEEIGKRLGLEVFSDHYPKEKAFVQSTIEAVKGLDQDLLDVVGLIKRDPRGFYEMVKQSSFYRWWTQSVGTFDGMSSYVNLIQSIMAPNAQIDGSFMAWAGQCATVYRDYRLEQQRKSRVQTRKRKLTEEERQLQTHN